MDSGILALIISPLLAAAGIVVGKIVDKRSADGNHATQLITALQAEIARRDRIDAGRQKAYRVLEDYVHRLRRALGASGLDVPDWPSDEVSTP